MIKILRLIFKRFFKSLAKEEEEVRPDFNPTKSDWLSTRDYILKADADTLRAWIKFLVKNQLPCPKPFIEMAKRKITDPRSFEFFRAYSAKKQLEEFEGVKMKLSEEQMLNLKSPPRYFDEGPHLNKINLFSDWKSLLDWKSDLEFQGIKFSRIGEDLFEWKKNRLYK